MVDDMFKILGALLAIYTVYACFAGEVYAKAGAGGRTVSRQESPRYFWVIVTIYAVLSVALVSVF